MTSHNITSHASHHISSHHITLHYITLHHIASPMSTAAMPSTSVYIIYPIVYIMFICVTWLSVFTRNFHRN